MWTANGQKAIDVVEGSLKVRGDLIPNTHSRSNQPRQGAIRERLPVSLVHRAVVAPRNHNRARRDLGDQLLVSREHIAPDQHGLAMLPEQFGDLPELLNI